MPNYPFSILDLKNSDKKIKRREKKKDKEKYQRNKRETMGIGGGIWEISIY